MVDYFSCHVSVVSTRPCHRRRTKWPHIRVQWSVIQVHWNLLREEHNHSYREEQRASLNKGEFGKLRILKGNKRKKVRRYKNVWQSDFDHLRYATYGPRRIVLCVIIKREFAENINHAQHAYSHKQKAFPEKKQ